MKKQKKKHNCDDLVSSYIDRSRNIAVNLGMLELKTDFKRRNRMNLMRKKVEQIFIKNKEKLQVQEDSPRTKSSIYKREAKYYACRRQTKEANSCLQLGILWYLM
jgi:hypothetical protein